jgi:hypothetical protein
MVRPERLRQERFVQRICVISRERGLPKLKELFIRNRQFDLLNVATPESPVAPEGAESERLGVVVTSALARLSALCESGA